MRRGLRVAVLVCETPGIQALRACWRLLEPSIQASTGIEAAEGLSSASPSCGPGDRQRMRIARTAVRRRALATDLDSVPGSQRTGCMKRGSFCTSIVDICRHRGQLVPQFDSAHPSVGITQQKGH